VGHRVVSVEAQHGFRGPFGDHTVDSLRPVGRHMGQLTGAVGAQIVEEDRRRGLGQGLVQCSSSRPTRPYPCCAHAVPVRIFPSCSSRHAHILIMSRPPRERTSVAPEVQRFDDATPASGERILVKSTAANPNGGRERHHGCGGGHHHRWHRTARALTEFLLSPLSRFREPPPKHAELAHNRVGRHTCGDLAR
jgi:hypothetical protein